MRALERIPRWESALVRYLKDRARMPFAWFVNDCCTFANGGVIAITGEDLMTEFQPYRTAEEAGKLFRLKTLEQYMDERLPRADLSETRRGDLALVNVDRRLTLAIITERGLTGPGLNGSEILPRESADICWRVG